MRFYRWLIPFVFTLIFALPAFAQEKAPSMFIGADGCKTCHKKEKSGAQFGKWQKARHSKAYATLASEEALKIAKEKGIGNPQKAAECLKCHVTAYNVKAALLGKKYAVEDGVGCESCHGAGSNYKKKKTMKAITAGTLDGATVGLIKPDKKLCLGCHNDESPTFVAFDYEKALEKIAHPIPKK
ncbi:MAG: cytochrome C554 [Calditrichaeota bacterium]|nr:MAG: cytochrome C554 [Calditrichota bacterium]